MLCLITELIKLMRFLKDFYPMIRQKETTDRTYWL